MQQRLHIIFFRAILWCCLVCFAIPSTGKTSSDTLLAEKGFIDLRNIDFTNRKIKLNGEWEIYWQQLIESGTNATGSNGYVPFPKIWSKTTINGKQLGSTGYASYRLRLLLPDTLTGKKLAFQLPDTYCSYSLFVNGNFFCGSGKPGISKESTINKWEEHTLEVTIPKDTMELVLQVANFRHIKGGPYKAIVIGDKRLLFFEREEHMAYDLLLTGCLFMGGLFFFGLYLFGKHDKVILYFSLFCITYSYRIIGSGFYVLHSFLPGISWDIAIHLEYLSLFLSLLFFTLYTWYLYPEEANKTVFKIEVGASIALCAIVIIFPPSIFTQLINPFLVVMFSVILYAFYIYARAAQNKRLGAGYALLSTGVVCLVFILINLQYFGLATPEKLLLFLGYISFFFLQSLILSFRFAYILKKATLDAEQGLVAKSDFLSTMSHEIRTPLNSILGITNLMLRDHPTKDQQEQLNMMLFSANNLLAIVNDILDYNKIEAGKIKFEFIETDIASVCRNIIGGLKIVAEEKGIALKLSLDSDIPDRVLADPTRTSQILNNLVHNAIKFTRKGHVQLQVRLMSIANNQAQLRFSIEDTGIGIPQEKQKLIFEQFTQADTSTSRNFGGTGLGLAICKKLLELQGTELKLVSEAGKGSLFYFDIGFTIVKQIVPVLTTAPELPEEEGKPLQGVSILLVEDNEVNILVAKSFLEKWGAEIDIALNGKEALDKLDPLKHKLVLMDMHMPVMDGYDATKAIRARGIRIPVIALTASLAQEVEHEVRYAGIDAIVVKPFVPQELFRTILHYTGIYRSL